MSSSAQSSASSLRIQTRTSTGSTALPASEAPATPPIPYDGEDPIISQAQAQRTFNLPPQNAHLTMARWVFTTGGEFFISPSISALKQLSGS